MAFKAQQILYSLVLVSMLVSYFSHSVFSQLFIEIPDENDTDDADAADDFRYSRPIARQTNPEDDYELDPRLAADPLNISAVAQPEDYVGMSVLGVLKVVQMFRMVGAPLAEPYIGTGPPAPPAAPGAPPPAPVSSGNPYLPYLFMMNSFHGGGSNGGIGGGGNSG